MKKILRTACLIGFVSFFASSANAQISVNFNVSAQPLWGPTGYNQVSNYYIPDIETYYNVTNRQYIYQDNNKWIFSSSLPSRYSGYNLYNGYKVVVNDPKPYLSFSDHKVKYSKFKGVKGKQSAIRYSNDPKYFVIKGHPKHPHGGAPGQGKKATAAKISHGSNDGNGNSKSNDNGHSKGGGGNSKGNGKGKH